MQNPQEEAG